MSSPIGFAFAVHIHQPVGNFDHVFEEHVAEVYRPFLRQVTERECYPITLHVSGPLLDWLDRHDRPFVDAIGRLVSDGHVELLGSGRYEPILASLAPVDRVAQVEEMRAFLSSRFGVEASGLWLTERVWEPGLVNDLTAARVAYTLLDDRHFLTTGLAPEVLDRPWTTESGDRSLTVLSIDERLRYLIPFRPVPDIEAFVTARHEEGTRLLVLGDDGEKFGGWPDTREWVYGTGWLGRFLDLLERLRAEDVLEPLTTGEAARRPPGGLVYPTPGSYREMEEWTLARAPAADLARTRRLAGADDDSATRPWVRGGQWRNFLVRYAESARMHAMSGALSRICRERQDRASWRSVAAGQCNDAYWHGIFGGVYLPHLRAGVWRALADAERGLRAGEDLEVETLDWDLDGSLEVWVHSSRFSAVVSPARGGAIEVLQRLESRENDADGFTRYHEAYHGEPGIDPPFDPGAPAPARAAEADDAASIHDSEPELRYAPPGVDSTPRALFQERVFAAEPAPLAAAGVGPAGHVEAPLIDLAGVRFELAGVEGPGARDGAAGLHGEHGAGEPRPGDAPSVRITLQAPLPGGPLIKTLTWSEDGRVRVSLDWSGATLPTGAWVSTEVSLATARPLRATPAGREDRAQIVTLARSERGFEEILQGVAVRFAWPAGTGVATVELDGPPVRSSPTAS